MKALNQAFTRVRLLTSPRPATALFLSGRSFSSLLSRGRGRRRPLNSSSPRKVLQFQSTLFESFSASFGSTSTAMSSVAATAKQQNVDHVLSFWFDDIPTVNWFRPADPAAFDATVRENFGELVVEARGPELDDWADDARGSLALVVLLDQFTRNIYRGSPEAHASDAKARDVAVRAVARGHDRLVAGREGQNQTLRALFFYLPLMHDEQLVSQVAAVALVENLLARCPPETNPDVRDHIARSLKFAEGHRDTILEFARFPSRNGILGRESTPEEIEFLKEHPSGFY